MAELRPKSLPPFVGWAAALGPGIVWMALAQGSAELIWWPYLLAKYGLAFLFLLIPACLLQYPVNYEIGRYTLLTGESIWQGFIRLHRGFALLLWALMTVSFLWFGAFASAGGTALAALTHFPAGWSARGQSLFWGYASITVFAGALLFSRVAYRMIEKVMMVVAVVTVLGLLLACTHHDAVAALPEFVKALVVPGPMARPWDPAADATKLLTAIAFAGLGGFWTLFYSYWLREKGAGMAKHFGHITSPLTGAPEVIPDAGFVPADDVSSRAELPRWRTFLVVDSGIGIFGNIFTTLMTCLLGYALLRPKGLLPDEYQLAVVQSEFFAASWGVWGRALFLVVAAAFLADTWLSTVDAVSRTQTDIVLSYVPAARRWAPRVWYYVFIGVFTVITAATMPLAAPGPLILMTAVIGFLGTVLFVAALWRLNHVMLPPLLPEYARPGWISRWLIGGVWLVYLSFAIAYLVIRLV